MEGEEIPEDDEDEEDDTPYEDDDPEVAEATRLVRSVNKATVSFLQRQMKIGYFKASRLMDELERRGVVGPYNGSEPREVLVYDQPDDGVEEGDGDVEA